MASAHRIPLREPEPDLYRVRAQVMAVVDGAATARQPPAAVSDWPLRPLPPELRAKLAGAAQPRPRASKQRSPGAVAGPAAAFAALDAVLVVVGFATGHAALGVGALVLFLLFAGVAVAARRGDRAAPTTGNGLTAGDRRTLAAACRWSSARPWTGDLGGGPELGVVLAAAGAAERIGRAPRYRAAVLGAQPVVDVAGELDRIDDAAHDVAMLRRAEPDQRLSGAPVEVRWSAVVTRAAALSAYAEALNRPDRGDDTLATLLAWYADNAGSDV